MREASNMMKKKLGIQTSFKGLYHYVFPEDLGQNYLTIEGEQE